jgi:hypothetical protein
MFTALTFSTLFWLTVALAGVALVTLLAAQNARPASSIAKVLHDVEHPERRR